MQLHWFSYKDRTPLLAHISAQIFKQCSKSLINIFDTAIFTPHLSVDRTLGHYFPGHITRRANTLLAEPILN